MLDVSHHFSTVFLHRSYRYTAVRTTREIKNRIRRDAVVRQNAQSLKFRGREEDVTVLLQRCLSYAVNIYDPQLLVINQVG